MFNRPFDKFIQLFCIAAAKILVPLFGQVSVAGKEYLIGRQAPIIIAINHQSCFDVPVLAAAVPLRKNRFLPVRFLAWSKLFRMPILSFFLRLGGAIPVEHGGSQTIEEKLSPAAAVLRREESIGIFPEGKRYPVGEFEKPHPVGKGAGYLWQKTRVPVIPILIRWSEPPSFGAFLRRRIRARIVIGEPLVFSSKIASQSHETISSIIFNAILALAKIA